MRISDWSSDVCSSDLADAVARVLVLQHQPFAAGGDHGLQQCVEFGGVAGAVLRHRAQPGDAGRVEQAAHVQHAFGERARIARSEEHTSELQSLMRISYAVFCLKKKTLKQHS